MLEKRCLLVVQTPKFVEYFVSVGSVLPRDVRRSDTDVAKEKDATNTGALLENGLASVPHEDASPRVRGPLHDSIHEEVVVTRIDGLFVHVSIDHRSIISF